jgi:RND superfamily putative drug exporter
VRAAARLLVQLRLLIPLAWLAVAVLMATEVRPFNQDTQSTVGGLVPTHGSAAAVERRSVREFGAPLLSRVAVVQRDPRRLRRPAVRGAIVLALRIARRQVPLLRHIAFALPIENRGTVLPAREQRTTMVTFLFYRASVGSGARIALAETYASRLRQSGGAVVGVTGTLPAREAELSAINRALPTIEATTVAVIALILLLVFRALGPALVTFASAGVAYVIAVRLLTVAADALKVDVPRELEPLLIALILGLTTDYTVFFFSGVKQRLLAGEAAAPALGRTARTFLPMIVTAGLIVALGSASLVFGRLALFRAFGPGMAISALVALAVAVTFAPAMLAIFGRALFWPGLRLPRSHGIPEQRTGKLRWFASHRVPSVAVTVLVAAGLALAALQIRHTAFGLPLLSGLSHDSEARQAYDAAAAGFTPGVLSPTELLVEGRGLASERPRLARLQRELGRFDGVSRVVGPAQQPQNLRWPLFISRRSDAARYVIFFDSDPLGARAIHTLRRLRSALPTLLGHAGLRDARAAIAGDTALIDEAVRATRADILSVGLALLLINLLLLAILLRAVLAPLYLLLASALALAATLGVATWFFQNILGYPEITYYVPFAASVLLLSLGSDYNIFITGQISKAAEQRPLQAAVATATPRASGPIAIAGITLAASFALLAIVPTRPMREFAFVMAAGILIDSFIVRSLLVPSLISAVGRLSWWPRRAQGRQPEERLSWWRRRAHRQQPKEPAAKNEIWNYRDRTWATLKLVGCSVEAIDGGIGKIKDASYDVDASYIVVDTGPWILGKKVLLPAGVVERVDLEYDTVYVNRSKDQIQVWPEFDPNRYHDEHYRIKLDRYYQATSPRPPLAQD